MGDTLNYFPPASFYFRVSIGGAKDGYDAQFQEVSGLEIEQDVEEIKEGGENDFSWRVPGRVKFNNLVLKRGMVAKDSGLVKWVNSQLIQSAHLNAAVEVKTVDVELMDEKGDPLKKWSFERAYPVKWSTSNLSSQDNSVVVETVEFAYKKFTISPSG